MQNLQAAPQPPWLFWVGPREPISDARMQTPTGVGSDKEVHVLAICKQYSM